jgi:hypothetical protein
MVASGSPSARQHAESRDATSVSRTTCCVIGSDRLASPGRIDESDELVYPLPLASRAPEAWWRATERLLSSHRRVGLPGVDHSTIRAAVAPVDKPPAWVASGHSRVVATVRLPPRELRGRVFRGSDAVRRGLLTARQLQGQAWRRLYRDVYADASLPDTHRLRCEGAVLLLPAGSALTGRSAACVRGLPLGESGDPVLAIAPPGRPGVAIAGVRLRRASLRPEEVRLGRIPTTMPVRTAWEIAREPNLIEAVTALDVLLRHRHVRADDLAARAAAQPYSRAARAIRLADGRAGSPQESRTRVRLALAGLPPPVLQFEIWRGGVFLGRVDFAWPEHRVALEYDGVWHAERAQLRRDRRRLNRLVSDGWTVLHVTSADLASDEAFGRLVGLIRAALELTAE